MTKDLKNYKLHEKKIISSYDRFSLSNSQYNEIKKDFKKSKTMIIGAAGSIGKEFTFRMMDFDFRELYLMDKDENQLTDLNRELVRDHRKKIKKINFICADLNIFNLDQFFIKNKISHYLNFAAVKHVRSEENLHSIHYMLMTNSKNFLPKTAKINNLKKIFSISTDKAVHPSSLLGVSKKIMEEKLYEIKKKNSKLFVSTTRFANVSFSNGSILKLIIDNLISKKDFGIPLNINRFFITHKEASSLCLKSLLKECDGHIIVPKHHILGKGKSIYDLCIKIIKNLKLKFKIIGKKIHMNNFFIYLEKRKIVGQKSFELLYEKNESISFLEKDNSVYKIKLKNNINLKKIFKIEKFKSISEIKNFFKKNISSYKPLKSNLKISKNI